MDPCHQPGPSIAALLEKEPHFYDEGQEVCGLQAEGEADPGLCPGAQGL